MTQGQQAANPNMLVFGGDNIQQLPTIPAGMNMAIQMPNTPIAVPQQQILLQQPMQQIQQIPNAPQVQNNFSPMSLPDPIPLNIASLNHPHTKLTTSNFKFFMNRSLE
jgi:hypothetical protein